jgi:hypothetical protein
MVTDLQEINFGVHFSFNLRTSQYQCALCAVVPYSIWATWDVVTVMSVMEPLDGPYTGANQAQIICRCLEQYALRYNLG